jgi:nucleoside-diphosphate-sugar epimerase
MYLMTGGAGFIGSILVLPWWRERIRALAGQLADRALRNLNGVTNSVDFTQADIRGRILGVTAISPATTFNFDRFVVPVVRWLEP